MADPPPPKFPIPPNNSCYDTSWLPEHPHVAPGSIPIPPAPDTLWYGSVPFEQPAAASDSRAPTGHREHSESHSSTSYYDPDTASNTGPHSFDFQHKHQWASAVPNPLYPDPANLAPFHDPTVDRLVLPPFSMFPDPYGVLAARSTPYADTSGSHSTMSARFAQPIPPAPAPASAAAPLLSMPPHLASNHPGFHHARTASAASSYNLVPVIDRTPVPSVTSTESLPTPDTTNSRDIPWQSQPKRDTSGSASSSSRLPSDTANRLDFSSAHSGILDRSWYAAGGRSREGPLRSPIRARTLEFSVHVEPAAPAASAREAVDANIGDGADIVPGSDAQQPTVDNPNGDDGAQPESLAAGAVTFSGRLRPGGQPYISPDEFAVYLSNPPKKYCLHEYRLIVMHFFDLDAPLDLFEQALIPSHRTARDPFVELSRGMFQRRCDTTWLRKHFKVIIGIYRAIRTFSRYYSLEGWDWGNEDAIMLMLAARLDELRRWGIDLRVQPWHMLNFVRSSWYYQMHARLRDHPAVQDTTDFHSGGVSPASVPAHLLPDTQ
ncbi:hypothetical protein FRC06_009139, partial [Ceratobasidium sp. 370]